MTVCAAAKGRTGLAGVRYWELDEVRGPEDLLEVGVRADDRGVVIAGLHNLDGARRIGVEVEYVDGYGDPKAYVVYTPDLSS